MTNFDPQEAERLAEWLDTWNGTSDWVVWPDAGYEGWAANVRAAIERLAAAQNVIEAVKREIATMPGFGWDYTDTAKALREYDPTFIALGLGPPR